MVEVKKAELTEVRCPYCDDFYDYIIPSNFFWEEEEDSRTVWCHSQACGKPFIVMR